MHKKSGWRIIGTNAPIPMTEEQYRKYKKKMFKWGLLVDKMPISKPKLNKKTKSKEKENAENK